MRPLCPKSVLNKQEHMTEMASQEYVEEKKKKFTDSCKLYLIMYLNMCTFSNSFCIIFFFFKELKLKLKLSALLCLSYNYKKGILY